MLVLDIRRVFKQANRMHAKELDMLRAIIVVISMVFLGVTAVVTFIAWEFPPAEVFRVSLVGLIVFVTSITYKGVK